MDRDDSNLPDAAPAIDPGTRHPRKPRSRLLRIVGILLILLIIAAVAGFFVSRRSVHKAMAAALPQIDGSIIVAGLHAPVTIQRDAQGVPHIRASSMDDLVFAQGFVTAQDRLWQMDLLRRHAAGELATILGPSMLAHDRLQRTLQLNEAADRAVAALPADQKHWLDVYAHGVNASIALQRAHLPLEFILLHYQPAYWTPRDSLLVELAMYQDLTTSFPEKFGREALAAHLPPQLIADLYPTGSWRDHPPEQPIPDVTAVQPKFVDIPLDKSQTLLHTPPRPGAVPTAALLALDRTLDLFHPCQSCFSGSNGWAVAGSRTASGKPILSNDMHLTLSVPGLWYEVDLEAPNPAPLAPFHVAGVSLPGTPFVIVGHNDHVAWGFTNLGADVQDLYIEHTRGTPTGAQYQTADGAWLPIHYRAELIHVRGRPDVTLNVPLTQHGGVDTPIVTNIFPGEKRSISLRWTVYDPANVTDPFFSIDSATDWPSMLDAFSTFGGPPQNMMYADDQGHIGYHAVGHIPVRGSLAAPSPLTPVPTDATGPDAASQEWAGYIPFNQLPQALDPTDAILATANSRVTPDNYPYPITLDWMDPYRTERIYKVLEAQHQLTPAESLALENDVFSEFDQVVAQRLAYAIDHATGPLKNDKALHQAADILRGWDGSVDANAPAPAIVNAANAAFWPMLLIPKLAPELASSLAKGEAINKKEPSATAHDANLWQSYIWAEKDTAEEQLLSNTPARWLPTGYKNWDDFLAAVVQRGLKDAKAPRDLRTWSQGKAFPIDLEHPIYSRSTLLQRIIGVPTGTGPQPSSGDATTVKQIHPGVNPLGPSERFTTDFGDLDHTTLNLVLGQSGNVSSRWYMDQFPAWLHGTTYTLPFTPGAIQPTITHTLTLTPP